MGQQKGSAYERRICKALSLWVSERTRDDIFWRTASSGGRATIRNRQRGSMKIKTQLGDICAVHSSGQPFLRRFFVECKHKRSIEVQSWIYGRLGMLPEIWIKPSKQAKNWGKHPLCIVKQNRQDDLVLTTCDGYSLLSKSVKYGKLPLQCMFDCDGDWVYVFYFHKLLALGEFSRLLPHLKAPYVYRERL